MQCEFAMHMRVCCVLLLVLAECAKLVLVLCAGIFAKLNAFACAVCYVLCFVLVQVECSCACAPPVPFHPCYIHTQQ